MSRVFERLKVLLMGVLLQRDYLDITVLVAAVVVGWLIFRRSTSQVIVTDAENLDRIKKNLAIVNCSFLAEDKRPVNQQKALQARSRANARLNKIFGIDNSLTTDSVERYREFKSKARETLNAVGNKGWQFYSHIARELAANEVKKHTTDTRELRLVPLVQCLAFKMALQVLFDVDALSLDTPTTETATKEINRLWIASKTDLKNEKDFTEQATLLSALRALVRPFDLTNTKDNPLNFIIPAYETMWRVVILGYLECCHRNREFRKYACTLLRDFLTWPDPAFEEHLGGHGSTALDIAKETLRLYPSNKRIYREANNESDVPLTYAADVEGMHRFDGVWAEPDKFSPERWSVPQTEMQRKAYIPFGSGRFVCPAKAGFGLRMIALLIAALAEATEGYELLDECAFEDGPLPSGRMDLDHVILKVGI